MKKRNGNCLKIVLLIVFSISLFPVSVHTASEQELSKSFPIILTDKRGKIKKIVVDAVEINGMAYLPLKEVCLFYRIGYTYDPDTKEVTLNKKKESVTLSLEKQEYKVGKKKIDMGAPPVVVNWKTMVPSKGMASLLEALCELPVAWRASVKTLSLNDHDPVSFWEDHPQKSMDTPGKKVIEPGDVLSISVWQKGAFELDELTREREVEEDGTIKFPFVGNIWVSDLAAEQLEKRLASKLRPYIKEPEVTVRVKGEKEACKVQIFGAVRSPGRYEFKEAATVMEAINAAGGFLDNARLANVRVTRFVHHSPYVTEMVNCKEILYNGQRQYDIPLGDKDIIFVPKRRGFWGYLGQGISKMSPILTTTSLLITIILTARAL
jgi:protein involved in polysaccharide export with SLBB domain